MTEIPRFASCHPDRPYYSLGLCKPCYEERWKKKNSGKLKEAHRKYRQAHAEEIHIKKFEYNRRVEARHKLLIREARKRKLFCNLSLTEYSSLIKGSCYYCDGELPVTGGGLDRIDSSVGYVLDNVRPCCRQCNVAKNGYTEDEFKAWLERITKARWFNFNEQRAVG